MAELHDIKGLGPATAARLAEHGLTSVKRLAKADPDALTAVPGFGPARAAAVQAEARAALAARKPKPSKEPTPAEAAGEPGAAKRLDASNAIEDKKKAPKVPKKKKKRSKKKKKAKKA